MRRLGFICAVCVIPTLFIANYLPRTALYIFCAAALLFFLFAVFHKRHALTNTLLYISVWILIAVMGYTLSYELVYQRAVRYDGNTVTATVEVVKEPSNNLYIFKIIEAEINGEPVKIPGRIRSYLYGCDAEIFDRMDITASLGICENMYSLRADGIYLEAEIEKIETIKTPARKPLYSVIADFQTYIKDTMSNMVKGDEAGMAISVLTGDTQLLSRAVLTDLSRSGISHITSVSGMHLSILVGYFYLVISKLKQNRKLACILSLIFTFAIMAVAGFSPSVLRAGIMTLVLYVGYFTGMQADSLNSLGVAAALIGLASPFAVVDVGFVLSVLATLGIVVCAPWFNGKINERTDIGNTEKKILGIVSVTLSATAFTLPVMIFYFSQVSIVSLPTNVIIYLPVIFLLICGCLLCLLASVPVVGPFLALIVRLCSDFIIRSADFFSRLPWAAIYVKSTPVMLWLVFVVIIVVFCLLFSKKHRIDIKLVSALCAAVLLCNLAVDAYLVRDRLKITTFDIGRADCHAAVYNHTAFVFDCGSTRALSMLSENLKAQGIYTISYLIITNYSDSYSKAADEIFDYFGVTNVYMPYSGGGENREDILNAAAQAGSVVTFVSDITEIEDSGITAKLYPYSEDEDSGLTANLYFGTFNMLYMSSATKTTEKLMASSYTATEIDADVLIVGHHGIKDTTDSTFLSIVQPKVAIVTVKSEAYADVSERLNECGAAVYQTGLYGEISVLVEDDGEFYVKERVQ